MNTVWEKKEGTLKEIVEAEAPKSPLAPPEAVIPPAVENPKAVGLPVRCGGDKVYLIRDGQKHWLTSPEAMAKEGFKLGDEREIDKVSLAVFPEGEPIR